MPVSVSAVSMKWDEQVLCYPAAKIVCEIMHCSPPRPRPIPRHFGIVCRISGFFFSDKFRLVRDGNLTGIAGRVQATKSEKEAAGASERGEQEKIFACPKNANQESTLKIWKMHIALSKYSPSLSLLLSCSLVLLVRNHHLPQGRILIGCWQHERAARAQHESRSCPTALSPVRRRYISRTCAS